MRDPVLIRVLETPHYGLCHYCGQNLPLRRVVTYYRMWPVEACMHCGGAIQRHTNWLRDANRRYRENRRETVTSGALPRP